MQGLGSVTLVIRSYLLSTKKIMKSYLVLAPVGFVCLQLRTSELLVGYRASVPGRARLPGNGKATKRLDFILWHS